MKKIRNVKVAHIYRFFSSFDLADSIWILFLGYRDMTLFEIGLLEGVYHLTSILFEIPTGAIADLCGRRKTLIMGRTLGVLSAVLMLMGGNFFVYMMAMITIAAASNLNSGSEEALIYDSLLEAGEEGRYLKINGRLFFLTQTGAAIGALLGGFVSEFSFEIVYSINIIARIVACIIALFFKEVKIGDKEQEEEKVTIKQHFKVCYRILKENPKVARISIFYACISTAVCTVQFYSQDYFSSMGMRNSYISTLGFVAGLVAAIGALMASWLHGLFKNKTLIIMCLGIGTMCVVMFMPILPSAIPGYIGLLLCNAIAECILSNQINIMLPSAQRATLLSVNSMLFSIGMVVIFPLCGLIMTYIKMGYVFATIGAVTLMITVISKLRKTY